MTSTNTLTLNKDINGDNFGSLNDIAPVIKLLDYSRLSKLCNLNQTIIRRNLHELLSHLLTMISGNNVDAEFTKGKLMRIDFKVGVLNI